MSAQEAAADLMRRFDTIGNFHDWDDDCCVIHATEDELTALFQEYFNDLSELDLMLLLQRK